MKHNICVPLIRIALIVSSIFMSAEFSYAQGSKSFSEGFNLMQQGLFEQAVEKFQQSIKEDSNYTASYGKLGLCLEKLKNYDEAVQVWRIYGQKNPQVKAQIQTHIMLLGKMKEILPSVSKGDVRSVIGTIKEILKDPYPESVIALDCATALAHDYFVQKQYPQAYSAYSQIVGRYAVYLIDDTGLYEYAVLLTVQDKNYLESARFYKEIANRPHSGYSKDDILNLIAECYKNEADKIEKSNDKDKDKKVRLLYEKIVLECPTSRLADMAKSKVGDIAKAIGERKELTDIYFSEGKYQEALELYQTLAINSKDKATAEHAQFQVGRCLATLGNHSDAVKTYHDIVRNNPNSAYADDALVSAGCLLAGLMGKPDLGVKEFEMVIKKYPKGDMVDDALFYTAYVYLRILNQPKKAIVGFNKLIKEYPDSAWATRAKEKLEEMQRK